MLLFNIILYSYSSMCMLMNNFHNKIIIPHINNIHSIRCNTNLGIHITPYYNKKTNLFNYNIDHQKTLSTINTSFMNIDNIKYIYNEIVKKVFVKKVFVKKPIDVYIHIEELYSSMKIYHIGVSFYNGKQNIRFDYRPFNEDKSYISDKNRDITFKDRAIDVKTLYWGTTNMTIEEIIDCEMQLTKRYKHYFLGINDCRHYAHRITKKTTGLGTPIWKLKNLWK